MIAADADWELQEQQLDALFTSGCDPYQAGAVALLDKPGDAVTQDERDIMKRVFMRMAARRGYTTGEPSLRSAADLFHEVGSALTAEKLLVDVRNAKIADSLRGNLRTRDQIKKIATDGFELCVRALAEMGAADVTIHECGKQALGEEPWGGENVD
jgi:hypothetical protein